MRSHVALRVVAALSIVVFFSLLWSFHIFAAAGDVCVAVGNARSRTEKAVLRGGKSPQNAAVRRLVGADSGAYVYTLCIVSGDEDGSPVRARGKRFAANRQKRGFRSLFAEQGLQKYSRPLTGSNRRPPPSTVVGGRHSATKLSGRNCTRMQKVAVLILATRRSGHRRTEIQAGAQYSCCKKRCEQSRKERQGGRRVPGSDNNSTDKIRLTCTGS